MGVTVAEGLRSFTRVAKRVVLEATKLRIIHQNAEYFQGRHVPDKVLSLHEPSDEHELGRAGVEHQEVGPPAPPAPPGRAAGATPRRLRGQALDPGRSPIPVDHKGS